MPIDCLRERTKTIEGHSDDLDTTASMFVTKLESLDYDLLSLIYLSWNQERMTKTLAQQNQE